MNMFLFLVIFKLKLIKLTKMSNKLSVNRFSPGLAKLGAT